MLHLTLTEWLASLVAGGAVVLGVAVGGVLLARRPGSRTANRAMGWLLFAAAAAVLLELVVNVRPPDAAWSIVFLPLSYTYALGPLLYLYVRIKLGRTGRLPVWHWVLPALQAALTVGVALAPTALQVAYMNEVYAPWYGALEDVVFAASLGGYLMLSYHVLNRAEASERFDWERSNRVWLRRLLAGSGLAFAVSLGFNVAGPLAWYVWSFNIYAFEGAAFAENVAYSALLYWIAVNGFVQAVPQARAILRRPAPDPRTSDRKAHYNLSPDLVVEHVRALNRLVASERPHLNPDLTLPVLADQLGVTDKVLSYVLNEGMGTTYTDYVNGLRVDEAKARLAAPEAEHLTVLGIGLDAGFRSKATFNRAFKRATGQTPSAFRAAGRLSGS
ncbi:MAG: AraC family transcriptional regulator [Bacteroidota bacterium]